MMNMKKFLLASLATFFVYEALTHIMQILIFGSLHVISATLGDLIWAFIFVLIFIKGYQGKGWIEGLWFGLMIGILFSSGILFGYIPGLTNMVVTFGTGTRWCSWLPLTTAILWFLLNTLKIMICGVLTAIIYKPVK